MKKITRRSFLKATTGTAMLGALSLSGCGASSEGAAVSSGEAKDPQAAKSLVLWSRGTSEGAYAEAVYEGAAEYEKQTGIKVEVQFIPFSDVVTKWNAAFASDTAPDVIDVGIVHIAERVKLNHLLPLDSYFENWEQKDDLFETVKELGSINDTLYCIGHYPDPQIFVYRKDLFEQAGLDPEKAPENWEELLDYTKKLTTYDANGEVLVGGMSVPTQQARYLASIFVRQTGGAFADENENVPTFTSPESVEAMTFLSELQKYSVPYDNAVKEDHPLLNDTAAMGYIPNVSISNYLASNPDMQDKFGFVSCVPGAQAATWSGTWFYSVSSQSKNPDEAWALIETLLSPEIMEKRAIEKAIPSTFASTMEGYIEQNPVINQAIADGVACGYGNPKVVWAPVYEKAIDTVCEEVFYGQKTVEEALQDAQDALLKEIG